MIVTSAGERVDVPGKFVTVTALVAVGLGPATEELGADCHGAVADGGIETVMVGVIEGQGDVMVITWTETEDVAVGLQGTVTVLTPSADDAGGPDSGAPTLDCSVSVLV